MNQSLLETYALARYVVKVAGKIQEFRVGQHIGFFNQLLETQNHLNAIFITGFNPHSEYYPLDINLKSNRMLLREIKRGGYRHFIGYGHDDAREWSKELSFLVIGITRDEADEMAKRFKQNAYLWIEINSPVELVSTMKQKPLP